MGVLDTAKAHFQTLQDSDMPYIEVPEWGEGNEPLKIYFRVMTLKEQDAIYKHMQDSSLKSLAQTLITRARNEDGTRMFLPRHMTELMTMVDPDVVSRICVEMAGDQEGDAVKN